MRIDPGSIDLVKYAAAETLCGRKVSWSAVQTYLEAGSKSMSLLTQRALRVFAVLEDYPAGSADILDALLPLFEPFIADRNGQLLEPNELASAVATAYRWNLTADIIEELVPRFEARGWMEECEATDNAAVYKIVYQGPTQDTVAQADSQIGQALAMVSDQFQEFIREISPLTAVGQTTDDLSELLIEWLVSIDAYTEDALRQQVIQTTRNEGTIGLAIVLPDDSRLSSEDRYLCARFIKHLWDANSPYVAELCKIASVGLLTEVIQDFRKPTGRVEETNLHVYLDAPVALDLIGVSGKAAAENIRPIIKQLQVSGASIRIFRISVGELQRALQAVLAREPHLRTGPTADAIRRNELVEAFARQIAQDPDAALAEHDVHIVDRKLDQFPGQHHYFTEENYEALFQRINWHLEVQPREHDASLIAFVLRMRGDTKSSDLFATRHVLVTRNPLLAQLSRRFCQECNLIAPTSVGPAVHQRQLATAVWLRTGLWNEAEEVPKRYLLAACERVLELKKSVIDKVRSEARNLTREKAQQLDLLLTQARSAQVLMDKTLNVPQVVGPSNIETLVDTMRRSIAEEIEEDASRQVDEAKRNATARVRRARGRTREAEARIAEVEAVLQDRDAEDEQLVRKFLGEVNSQILRRRKLIRLSTALAVLLFALLPWASEALPTSLKVILGVPCIALAWFLGHQQIWDRSTGLARLLDRWDQRLLRSLAEQRGLTDKLVKFTPIFRADHRFELHTAAPDQQSGDILGAMPSAPSSGKAAADDQP